MSWYEALGLSGLCSTDQVVHAFREKVEPYRDQEWDSMHFEEKQRVQELLDAFEVLGGGKSAQLLYQQFLCSKTIHGYAPVDPTSAYTSTFDSTDPQHTTVMPVPTTDKNTKDMIRLATMFHAYRMLGHAITRTASMDTITRHYQQFRTDLTKLAEDAAERSKVQKLEGLPASTDQAFWQARMKHANTAFTLLSEHREQYDQILTRGSMNVVLQGWSCRWSERLRVLSSIETLNGLVLKTSPMSTTMAWKPFPVKKVKLKAVFKLPDIPANIQAMEDDEENTPPACNDPPTKRKKKKRKQPDHSTTTKHKQPDHSPKKKKRKQTDHSPKKKKRKPSKKKPKISLSVAARELALARAKQNRSSQPPPSTTTTHHNNSDSELMALMASLS